jgi:hypothetical protein
MLKGNENYQSFQSERLITTEFNICEVGFAVCREYPADATRVLRTVRKMVIIRETQNEDYCAGALRRKEASVQKKKVSTIDCVGYSVANRLNIPFLTGDREFADLDNVQFVR